MVKWMREAFRLLNSQTAVFFGYYNFTELSNNLFSQEIIIIIKDESQYSKMLKKL